jgi:hypothetical protein
MTFVTRFLVSVLTGKNSEVINPVTPSDNANTAFQAGL